MPLIDFSKIALKGTPPKAAAPMTPAKGRKIDFNAIKFTPIPAPKQTPVPAAVKSSTPFIGRPLVTPVEQQRMKAATPTPPAVSRLTSKYDPQKYNPEVNPVAPLLQTAAVKRWSAEAAAARKATPEIGQRLLDGMDSFTKIIQPNIAPREPGRNTVVDFVGSIASVAAGVYAVKSLLSTLGAGVLWLKTPRTVIDRETTTLFPRFDDSFQAQKYVLKLQQTDPAAAEKFKSDLVTLLAQTMEKDMPVNVQWTMVGEKLVSRVVPVSERTLQETASRMYDFLVSNGQAGSFATVGERFASATTAVSKLAAAVGNPQMSLAVAEQVTNQLAKTGMLQLLPPLVVANRLGTIPMPAGLVHSTAPAIPMGGKTLPVPAISKAEGTLPSATSALTTKQPWEMTKEEFNKVYPMKKSPYSNKGFRNELITDKAYSNPQGGSIAARKEIIQKALSDGKPVPPSVLADYPDLKTTAPAVVARPVQAPAVKSYADIMAKEEEMGAALNTTPRAVDKTIPAIDVKKANLVDVTAKVDLKSVQVKFPTATNVFVDTKRGTVLFTNGTTPLEAIGIDKPQLETWYGIEGAKLLGEATQPAPIVQSPVAQIATTAKQPWEMTRKEFISAEPKMAGVKGQAYQAGVQHSLSVKQALAEGKPVPPEVLADYPDLTTTPQIGTATTISNQKTSISTPTPISPRVGTQTGASEVKWGKWIDAVGSRRTDGVGGYGVETIKTPITYRLGSGTTPVRAYAPTKAADKGISGPFVPETGKRLELKGDPHTYYITQKSEADAAAEGSASHSEGLASYRPFSVLEASSGNLIGWGDTVKNAIGNAQETINNFKEIYGGRVEQAVADHGEVANPVPTALLSSTSAPAAAPSLGNAINPLGRTNVERAVNGTQPYEMGFDQFLKTYAVIPPMEPLPEEGQYTAIETDDGSVFVGGDENALHIEVAMENGVPFSRLRSGGTVRAGVYYGGDRSSILDVKERALAAERIRYKQIVRNEEILREKYNLSGINHQGEAPLKNATPVHGLIDYSKIELNGTTSVTSPAVLKSVSNTGKRSRVETEGFDNYIQNTPGTTDTSLSPFAKFKAIRDGYIRFIANEYNWFFKSPLGGEWMTIAVAADDLMLEEYKNPFFINEAGEQVFVEGEFGPKILSRYLKASDVINKRYLQGANGVDLVAPDGKKIKNPNYGKPDFGVFLQNLQRAGIPIEATKELGADKTNLAQQHIADAWISLKNFQKNLPQLFAKYMAQAQEIGDANARLLPEFYKGIISPETYANDKANPHYYVSLSAGKTDIFDRSSVAPLERAHGLTNLDEVVPPLEGLMDAYVAAIRAQGINRAKIKTVEWNKSSEVATTVLSDSIVHLWKDGVDRAFEVHDKDAGASIRNLTRSKWEVPSLVKMIFTLPTTLMRLAATGVNIAFGAFNPVRDIIQAAGLVPFTPTGLVKGAVKAFKSPGLSQWSKDYRDPTRPTGTKVAEAVKKIVEFLSIPSNVGESLSRDVIAESIGSRGGTYLDQFYGYHAGTGFFALHGTFFNDFISGLVPFTRATIAVVRAFYRNSFYGLPIGDKGGTFSGKQGAEKIFGKNFLATIIFTLIEIAAIKAAGKEKEYKLLRDRASNFYLYQPSGNWVRLSVPILSAPIKAIVESLYGFESDPIDVAEQTLNVIPGLGALMLPPVLTTYLQYKFNINFFTGSPINTKYDTPAKNPLEAAIMKLGYTEEQADMALRSFFADIPSQVQYVFEMVTQGTSTQAFPLTKRFIVKDPTTSSNAAVDDFYALVDAVKASKNPALEHYVNGKASDIGKLIKNAKLYPAEAKLYMTTATDNIIATFATIAENPDVYGIKKFGPFSWRPSGNYEELAP